MATRSAAIESIDGERLTEPDEPEITFSQADIEFIVERARHLPFNLAIEVMQFLTFKAEGSQTNG